MKPLHEELKELRLEKGITLETINDTMKISMNILEKIEEGDLSVVPQPFLRAFLREYAEVIGIDPDRVMARYENKTDAIIKAQPALPERELEIADSESEPMSGNENETAEPELQDEEPEERQETHIEPKSSEKTETDIQAAPEPIATTEVIDTDSQKENVTSTPAVLSEDTEVISESAAPVDADKPVSEIQTETDTIPAVSSQPDQQTVPVERKKLEIEEASPMHTVSIVIFVIIIIVAAVVIFLINRGL